MTPGRNIQKRDVAAVVPLGGGGTRFYPVTLHTQKQLVPVANHPILGASLYHWIKEGATDVVFGATGYENRVQTKKFFGGGGRYAKLSNRTRFYFANYDDDVFSERGSADVFMWCLNEYRDMMGKREVLLINGDNLSTTSLGDFYQAHHDTNALMTIAVKAFNINDPRLEGYGTVVFDNNKRVTGFDEKSKNPRSRYANTGICMFSPEIHNLMKSGEFHRTLEERRVRGRLDVGGQFIPALVEYDVPIFAYVLEGPWADIGTFDAFQETTTDILHGKYQNLGYEDCTELETEDGTAVIEKETYERLRSHIGDYIFRDHCLIDRQSSIGRGTTLKNSVVGENVVVGNNVAMDETTLFPFSRVDDGVKITNAIIGNGTKIGSDSVIETGAFIGDNLRIPPKTKIGVDWRVARDEYFDAVMKAKASDGGPMYELVEKLDTMSAFAFKERRVQNI